jgi:ABC-type nickel/cobalt efflux system permease component RcnA
MTTLIAVILLGFFLGMRHATDPDHVIAVTTIVARQRSVRQAAWVGAFWGLGHTLTILVVGSAIILFKVMIPPRLGLTMELCVGLMLILLGLLNLTGVLRRVAETFRLAGQGHQAHGHTHPHVGDSIYSRDPEHAPGRHTTEEAGLPGRLDRRLARLGFYHAVRPLIVGIVHGLAGSAAVALLVLAAIHNSLWGVVYLLVFGAGTVAGMMLITAAIAVPYAYTGRRFVRWNRHLATASGVVSLLFGLFIAYRIGIADGLFTSHPSWTPR